MPRLLPITLAAGLVLLAACAALPLTVDSKPNGADLYLVPLINAEKLDLMSMSQNALVKIANEGGLSNYNQGTTPMTVRASDRAYVLILIKDSRVVARRRVHPKINPNVCEGCP